MLIRVNEVVLELLTNQKTTRIMRLFASILLIFSLNISSDYQSFLSYLYEDYSTVSIMRELEVNYTKLKKKKKTATSTESKKSPEKVLILRLDKEKGEASFYYTVYAKDADGKIQAIHNGRVGQGRAKTDEVVLKKVLGKTIFVEYTYGYGKSSEVIIRETLSTKGK